MIKKSTSVVEPMGIPTGTGGAMAPMGFSRYFAAFSQNILDRYAIWEKYPWSDAVIRYLENEKQEEASQKMELSSFFVTMQLLKIYLTNEREKEKAGGKMKEADQAELTLRMEAELKNLKNGYDRYYGILERLYREGAQMPGEELSRIWALLEREAGVRKAGQKYLKADSGPDIAVKTSAVSGYGGISPHALGVPGIRLRLMAEGHAHIPNGRALFQSSVERQHREFYTKLVRNYVVRETATQAEYRLGRELHPFEYQALKDYGDGLGRDELVFYVQEADARLYQEMAELVIGRLEDSAEERRKSGRLEDSAGEGQKEDSERKNDMEGISVLLSELPVWISRTAVRELLGENAKDSGKIEGDSKNGATKFQERQSVEPHGYEENLVYRMENRDWLPMEDIDSKQEGKAEGIVDNVPSYSDGRRGDLQLSELWEQSSQEERKSLLYHIPQAVRQAASLWEETGQGNDGFRQKKILETIVERIEAAQRDEVSQGSGTAQGEEVSQGPGETQRTEESQSLEVVRRSGDEFSDQRIPEEIGRILLELPAWVSKTAVRELYRENAGDHGTGDGELETGTARFQEQQPAMIQDYEENLVYRMENLDSVAMEGMRTKPGEDREAKRENMQLSERWEQSSQEERRILLYRIPQAVRQAASLWEETGQGNNGFRQKEILETIVERIEAVQRDEASQGSGAVQRDGASQSLEAVRRPEAEFSDQGIPKEIGRILSELPVWVSKTAVRELYRENAGDHGTGDEELETVAARFQKQQPAMIQGYGENLVYRMENLDSVAMEGMGAKPGEDREAKRENMQLSELWEQSSQEERRILLHRIPQAVRQAASLWEEIGQGNSGPRQKEILRTIVERIEAAQSLETIQRIETVQRHSHQRIPEEIRRILSELPTWVSKTAVRELYRENAGDHGTGDEELETGTARFQEQQPTIFQDHEENLVYHMENSDSIAMEGMRAEPGKEREAKRENMQLSELWEQSSQEERKILLHRIPQAVRQATFLWEEAAMNRVRKLRAEETGIDESQKKALKERLLLTVLTRFAPQMRESLPAMEIRRKATETFYWADPEMQMDWSSSQLQYTDRGENAIVYAAKAPDSSGVHQNNENMQVIQELESRISRQEYIIKQEQIEREELQRRMKRQESQENALWKPGDMRLTSKQGSNLSQNVLSQLKDTFRLERIRYGAD